MAVRDLKDFENDPSRSKNENKELTKVNEEKLAVAIFKRDYPQAPEKSFEEVAVATFGMSSYDEVIDSLVTHSQIYVEKAEQLIQQMLVEGVQPTRLEYQVIFAIF